jgi:hypothetical protein
MNPKILFGIALLAPLLGAAVPAKAAKKGATAARAECFKQAQAAKASLGQASTLPNGEGGQAGYDAYVSCCRKAGIAP